MNIGDKVYVSKWVSDSPRTFKYNIMTQLPLTEAQKELIIEMGKSLFPDFNKKYSEEDFKKLEGPGCFDYKPQYPTWCISDKGVLYVQLEYMLYEDMTYELIEMHWYEFVTTHLINQLFFTGKVSRDANDTVKDILFDSLLLACPEEGDFTYQPQHIVNRLYDFFKRRHEF